MALEQFGQFGSPTIGLNFKSLGSRNSTTSTFWERIPASITLDL